MRRSVSLTVLFLVVAGIAGYWAWSALGSNSENTHYCGGCEVDLVEINHEVLAGLGNGFFVKVDNSTFIASVKVLVKGERAEHRVYQLKNGKAELLGKLDAPFVTDVPPCG
jgi:hypothetical protein